MTNNKLIQRIRNGESLVPTMLSRMCNYNWAIILAGLPFDFMTIDMENSPYSDSEVSDMIYVLEAWSVIKRHKKSWKKIIWA